jgi:hypothetical protein
MFKNSMFKSYEQNILNMNWAWKQVIVLAVAAKKTSVLNQVVPEVITGIISRRIFIIYAQKISLLEINMNATEQCFENYYRLINNCLTISDVKVEHGTGR